MDVLYPGGEKSARMAHNAPMDQRELDCFLALAEEGSFTAGAARMYLSPSAFTRVIQRLEAELDCQLCHRTSREMQLTEAGLALTEYARDQRSRWKLFTDEMQRRSGVLSGELSIFATVTACYSILPRVLEPFRSTHPGVNIRLVTGDAADALEMARSGRVDCAIAPIPEHLPSGLTAQQLTVTPLVFVASQAASSPGEADRGLGGLLSEFPYRADWERIPLILPERGLGRLRIDRWFAARGIEPWVYARVGGNEGIMAMVSLGLGIGLVPELVVNNSPMAEGLYILPQLQEVPDFAVGIAARSSHGHVPVVRAFMEEGRKAFGAE